MFPLIVTHLAFSSLAMNTSHISNGFPKSMFSVSRLDRRTGRVRRAPALQLDVRESSERTSSPSPLHIPGSRLSPEGVSSSLKKMRGEKLVNTGLR